MAVAPCEARVLRPSSLDHHDSVDRESPARAANSGAVRPLRRHCDTVFDHHSRDLRSRPMTAMGGRMPASSQVRGPSDGYADTVGWEAKERARICLTVETRGPSVAKRASSAMTAS